MEKGCDLTIRKTANGYVVTPAAQTIELAQTYVFTRIGDKYSSDGLLGFIDNHFVGAGVVS